ncbi:MAG: hypothetical protein Q8P18_27065 [Pseudomonadota bacterium]|nr:hypothetical protein [Pseudomonadota bacterium]
MRPLGEDERLDHALRELVGDDLLPHVLLLPAHLRAAVVDVLALVDLGGHGGAAVPAREQALVQGVARGRARVRVAVEAVLNALPERPAQEDRVLRLVGSPAKDELAHVDGVAQEEVHRGGEDDAAALALDRVLPGVPAQIQDRVRAAVVHSEQVLEDGGALGIDDEDALVSRAAVRVPERGAARPVALIRLLVHALLDLLGEVVDVVLGHQHLDAVHELLGGPGLLGDHDVLLHEVDLRLHLVDGDPVLEVSVQSVGLLHQHDRRVGLPLPNVREHLLEVGAPGALGGFDVEELFENHEALFHRVLPDGFLLGGDRVAFLLLVAGRHAGVENRRAAGSLCGGRRGGGGGGAAGTGAVGQGRAPSG